MYNPNGFPANSMVVIAAVVGAQPRALHLANFFGEPLLIATAGVTSGHNAAGGCATSNPGCLGRAFGVAAVAWNSARGATRPFVGGAANPTEPFSSDGPRRLFYYADGTPITPGNLLFATNGGRVLIKPDIAAADGVACRTPGFSPFFGTSAAAPHAAGVAALLKSARPLASGAQIFSAITSQGSRYSCAGDRSRFRIRDRHDARRPQRPSAVMANRPSMVLFTLHVSKAESKGESNSLSVTEWW